MTTQAQSARDDIAFLRRVVEGPGPRESAAGRFFFITGLIWALDALVFWLHFAGVIALTQTQQLMVTGAATLIWLPIAILLRWGAPPKSESPAAGASARAYAAAGAGIGIVAIGTLAVFTTAAIRLDMGGVFILYPSMMFLCFAGMALTAWAVARRPLRLFIALGWFAAAVAMAAAPGGATFTGVATLAMLLLMALPGWFMMRQARTGG